MLCVKCEACNKFVEDSRVSKEGHIRRHHVPSKSMVEINNETIEFFFPTPKTSKYNPPMNRPEAVISSDPNYWFFELHEFRQIRKYRPNDIKRCNCCGNSGYYFWRFDEYYYDAQFCPVCFSKVITLINKERESERRPILIFTGFCNV